MRSFMTGLVLLACLLVSPATSVVGDAQGGLPTMTLSKSSLTFAAVTSGSAFTKQTSAQPVRVTQSGAGAVTWVATPSQPWLVVTPASGSGSATLTVSVTPSGGLPAAGTVTGAVTITYTGASVPSSNIAVTLRLQVTSTAPIGSMDTPVQNATGLAGAVPFTGWALDDIEVARIGVCRAAVGAEAPGPDARCAGQAEIYVGEGVFIDGARPDVQAQFATFPRNSQAGWGLMVLTNMLPGQGNGSYTFFMWAQDVEGQVTLLGTRTITCDNAHATLPFGTIDTPGQGETVSGSAYVNFGWALTQNPKYIPTDFPSLEVYIDGSPIGPPAYGYYRSDIATFFPGYANSNGAVGYKILDTTGLSNGLHTIVWTATDSAGFVEGLGSRYFTVSNGTAATSRVQALRSAAVSASDSTGAPAAPVPPAATGIAGRRGWGANAPWRVYPADASGTVTVQGQELDRFELQLNLASGEQVTGNVRVGDALQELPVGSTLDRSTGRFVWSPGVGFIGTYDLVFSRTLNGQVVQRQDVRIVLRPKTLGPQVVIDTPVGGDQVGQPFSVAGWAASLDATDGSGIDTIHVWAYPVSGAAPIFLGVANQGVSRPDVAAAYGEEFGQAGYELQAQGLSAGDYDLAVFAWSTRLSGFLPAAVTRVHVR